jgi:hypothetical protein
MDDHHGAGGRTVGQPELAELGRIRTIVVSGWQHASHPGIPSAGVAATAPSPAGDVITT